MKLQAGRTLATIIGLGALLAGSAVAQESTASLYNRSSGPSLYIAHAAAGRNISATANPDFPIDIRMNNRCIVRHQVFGEILGPFTAPGGNYWFSVTPANVEHPCSGQPIFSGHPPAFTGTGTYLGVLDLDASNNLTGQIYPLDLSAIPAGGGRIELANGTLDDLVGTISAGGASASLTVSSFTLAEGAPPAGQFTANVTDQATSTHQYGPATLQFESRDLYIYVLAGSAANSSIQLIGPRIIRDVF